MEFHWWLGRFETEVFKLRSRDVLNRRSVGGSSGFSVKFVTCHCLGITMFSVLSYRCWHSGQGNELAKYSK